MASVIPLTQGHSAVVDDDDFELVSTRSWSLKRCRNGLLYAQTNVQRDDGSWSPELLHRFITQALSGERIDHRNGDGLDCRKANLRRATHAQNMANRRKQAPASSHFKGVSHHKLSGKWIAYVGTGAERRHLGLFTDETAAAEAYDRAALELFGEFANLNFPQELAA